MTGLESLAYDIRHRLTRFAFEEAGVHVLDHDSPLEDDPDLGLLGALIRELDQWPPPETPGTMPSVVTGFKEVRLVVYYVLPERSPVWKTVRSHFDFVVPMLTQFASYPTSADFASPLEQIASVQERFNQAGFGYTALLSGGSTSALDAMRQVESAVDLVDRRGMSQASDAISVGVTAMIDGMTWTGVAAKAFRDRYGYRMPVYIGNDFALATVLRWSLEALQNMYVKVHTNAERIAKKTRDAPGSLLWGGDAIDLAMVFTVASAVISVGDFCHHRRTSSARSPRPGRVLRQPHCPGRIPSNPTRSPNRTSLMDSVSVETPSGRCWIRTRPRSIGWPRRFGRRRNWSLLDSPTCATR